MRYLLLFLLSTTAAAQTCTNAVVTQGTGTVSISLTGCSNSPTPTPTPTPTPVPPDGIPNPSKYAFKDGPIHAGLNGAGPTVNAWEQPPSRCITSVPLTRSWQHNILLEDYIDKHAYELIAMNPGEALTFKFTVGNVDTGGGFSYADASASGAQVKPAYMTITPTPCDFDVSKAFSNAGGNPCYISGINGTTVNWANITGPLPPSYCRLTKGGTYYVNIRFQDVRPNGNPNVDACKTGEKCGGLLQFQ